MPAIAPPVQHVFIDPKGIPRITGTRLRVSQIAADYFRRGATAEVIAEEYYPGLLTPAAVHAALAYYHDNKAAVDEQERRDEAFVEQFRQQSPPSPFVERLKELQDHVTFLPLRQ